MGVAHGGGADFIRIGVKPSVHAHFARIERLGNGERLHRRARLDHIGYRTVAALLAVGMAGAVGVVGGAVGQRQNFTGLRIQHHHAACFGAVVAHGFIQFFISQRLNALIERHHHIAAVLRIAVARRIEAVDDIAFVVAQHHFGTVGTAQIVFTRQLQPFLAFAVDVGEADYMRKQIAHRIMALRFFLESQTFDAQSRHFIAGLLIKLALQIDKVFVFFRQTRLDGFHRHINQRRELLQLLGARHFIHARGHGIKRFGRRAQRQGGAVAVGDGAARGRQRNGAHKALVALIFQKIMLRGLQIHPTPHQGGKGQRQSAQHKSNPPVGAHGFLALGLLGQHLRLVFVFD